MSDNTESVIASIMHRATAASGTAVFLDPVILGDLLAPLERELAEARAHFKAANFNIVSMQQFTDEVKAECAVLRAEAARFEGLMLAAESEAHDARAEVEAAEQRGFYAGWDSYDEDTTLISAWSRYQQERK